VNTDTKQSRLILHRSTIDLFSGDDSSIFPAKQRSIHIQGSSKRTLTYMRHFLHHTGEAASSWVASPAVRTREIEPWLGCWKSKLAYLAHNT
jgi:hypothetical protein